MRLCLSVCSCAALAFVVAGCNGHGLGNSFAPPSPSQTGDGVSTERVQPGMDPATASGIAEFSAPHAAGAILSDGRGSEYFSAGYPAAVVQFDEKYHLIGRSFFLPHPNKATYPYALALSPSGGDVWFSGNSGELGFFKPKSKPKFREFKLRTDHGAVDGLTAGPDHAMWFTVNRGFNPIKIGRISTFSHQVTSYTLSAGGPVFGITLGPDGAMWFAAWGSIGRIGTNGQATEYSIGGNKAYGITTGPDGAIWFTGEATVGGPMLGRIDLVTHARKIIRYGKAGTIGNQAIVTRGSSLWMTSFDAGTIDHYDTSTPHTIYRRRLPPGYTEPYGMALGADNQLWFINYSGSSGAIGKLCPDEDDQECANSP